MENNTKIVVIHDGLFELHPIIVTLEKLYGKDNVHFFYHSNDGLDFVLANKGGKMIVLLDKNFESKGDISGIEVFRKIRKETSLIYVILISANPLNEISPDELKLLINESLFKIDNLTDDFSNIIALVKEAEQELALNIDCVIEEWILRHPDHERQKPLIKLKSGKSYSMEEVLQHIRERSEVGLDFEKGLLNLAVTMFARQKVKLND